MTRKHVYVPSQFPTVAFCSRLGFVLGFVLGFCLALRTAHPHPHHQSLVVLLTCYYAAALYEVRNVV